MVVGEGEKRCGFWQFLSRGRSVFSRLGGRTAKGFGAGLLLPRGLASTAEPSLMFLLAVGGPLLTGAAVGLGL